MAHPRTSEALQHAASGDLGQARAALGRVPFAKLKDPNELNQLGQLTLRIDQPALGVKIYRRALKLAKNHPVLLTNLGLCHLKSGQLPDAIQSLRQAVRREPENLLARVNLASALLEHMDVAGARETLDVAASHAPDDVRVELGLALCAQCTGDASAALAHGERARTLDPSDARSWRAHIEGLLANGCSAEAEALALRAESSFPGDPFFPHALGRALDARGEHREAVQAWQRAHAHDPSDGAEEAAFRRDMHALLDLYRGWPQVDAPPVDPTQPIFVVGSFRSGTTLMERFLSAHSTLEGAGESPLIGVVTRELMNAHRCQDFTELVNKLWTQPTARAAARRKFDATRRAFGLEGKRFVDKMPSNAWRLGLLAAVAPGAAVVHMVRDGRETAFSAWTHYFTAAPWHARSLDAALFEWSASIDLVDSARRACPMPLTRVQYEHWVNAPEEVGRATLAFLGLEPEPGCWRFHERAGVVRTASQWQIRRPLSTERLGRAARHQELHARMTELARPTLERFGYLS